MKSEGERSQQIQDNEQFWVNVLEMTGSSFISLSSSFQFATVHVNTFVLCKFGKLNKPDLDITACFCQTIASLKTQLLLRQTEPKKTLS